MADIAERTGQHEELRYLQCLLCSTKKPFSGFLSHIRQKHFNYDRYKCTKCAFKCDTEENSIFHSIKKRHDVKFNDTNYQEHLAIKIFEDCCRQQIAIENGIEIQKHVNSGQTKRRRNWNSDSDVQKACILEKDKKVNTNDARSSVFVKHEINMQKISKNRNDSTVIPDSTRCLYSKDKQESETQITRNILNAADDGSESCKLSSCDDQTSNASGLFSEPFANIRSIDSDKFLNAHTTPPSGEISEFSKNTFGRKKREVMNNPLPQNTGPELNPCQKCGKEVAANYIARKTHALQFHFTQNDDPEIAELLPATIKACFPHSLSWSDYQCTQCGKALGTDGSRRNHVLKEHFYWSAICPISGCTVVINAVSDLEGHFKLEHNISKLKIPKSLKQKLRKMQNDRKNDLYRQLNLCFPCSLPQKRQVPFKASACDSRELPKSSITSVLSSLLHSQPSTEIKRKSFTYSSSDTESSSAEDTNSTGTKGKEHTINDKDGTLSTGCWKNMSSLNANVFCRDFYNQEMSSDMDRQQLCCTICHSQTHVATCIFSTVRRKHKCKILGLCFPAIAS